MPATIFDIVPASAVDYGCVDEICGYQMLLCKMYERAGGFRISCQASRTALVIRQEGAGWLSEVRKIMESLISYIPGNTPLSLGDMPRLSDSYDLFHRVCHGAACPDYIRQIRLETADSFLKGDRSITQAAVTLMLEKEIRKDIRAIPPRYIDYVGTVMSSWIDDLSQYGKLRNMDAEESYLALNTLLDQDLTVFGVATCDKLEWIESYTLPEAETDKLDINSHWTYMAFVQTAMRLTGAPMDQADEQYLRIVSKIASHPQANQFVRQAIELELAAYRAA